MPSTTTPTVRATRYVTPLREGGSLPGVMEGEDLGTYVVKFRGAGQGLKVLVAEVIVAGLAEQLGLRVPRWTVIDLGDELARYEPDEEVQDLLRASIGTNLGVDLLPGALGYDGSSPPDPAEAADIIWLDAFTANPDRTWANPNLLGWHAQTWVIDHGAALYFHHAWPSKAPNPDRFAVQPYRFDDHVLGAVAAGGGVPLIQALEQADQRAGERLDSAAIGSAIAAVPDAWLETTAHLPHTDAVRTAYQEHLERRLAHSSTWLSGANR